MIRLILNYKILFFYLLFFSIILKSAALAKTDKIGYLSMIDGDVTTVDSNNKFIKINEFDKINVGQVVIFAENSSSVILLDDQTILDITGPIEVTVSLFQNKDPKKKIFLTIAKYRNQKDDKSGKFIIESGDIAKSKTGEMIVKLPTSEIKFNGTLVSGTILKNADNVCLHEDNFGKVGFVTVKTESTNTSIYTIDKGLNVEGSNKASVKKTSINCKTSMDSFKQRFINVSVLNEKDIEKIIAKKLSVNGKIDAIIVKTATEVASKDKLTRIDYILRNTTEERTAVLSSIIKQSDKSSSESTISKMLDTKDTYVITKVISISDEKTSNSILKEAAVISSNQVKKQDLAVNILKLIPEITPVTLKAIDPQILELIVRQEAAVISSNQVEKQDLAVNILKLIPEIKPVTLKAIDPQILELIVRQKAPDEKSSSVKTLNPTIAPKNNVLKATTELQRLYTTTGNISPN